MASFFILRTKLYLVIHFRYTINSDFISAQYLVPLTRRVKPICSQMNYHGMDLHIRFYTWCKPFRYAPNSELYLCRSRTRFVWKQDERVVSEHSHLTIIVLQHYRTCLLHINQILCFLYQIMKIICFQASHILFQSGCPHLSQYTPSNNLREHFDESCSRVYRESEVLGILAGEKIHQRDLLVEQSKNSLILIFF